MKKYDVIVYIGRFQPPHKAHIQIIEKAKTLANNVLVLVGSSNQPRTIKNPWTWQERKKMIFASLESMRGQPIMIASVNDILYNNTAWLEQIQEIVANYSSYEDKIAIIGHSKDETSLYLKSFPQWDIIDVDIIDDLRATDIRAAMFESENFSEEIGNKLPHGIHDYIKSFMLNPEYEKLVEEYKFQQVHDRMWDMDKMMDHFIANEIIRYGNGSEKFAVLNAIEVLLKNYRIAPYKPYFNTVDVVVIQSGHVLMVKRRSSPGKGLWAIPGGYLNHDEWSIDSALRELKEKTKIKVPLPVLRGNIKANKIFEHPKRSLRGRVITHAYIIELPDGALPKTKGGDDAEKVKWIPLSKFKNMKEQIFEDHFSIIYTMKNLI